MGGSRHQQGKLLPTEQAEGEESGMSEREEALNDVRKAALEPIKLC